MKPQLISDLGWTRQQAALVRAQLHTFAEDWDDPSMDVYDKAHESPEDEACEHANKQEG